MQPVARELAEIAARLVDVVARLAVESSPDDMLPEAEAARLACCSLRTLRDARRTGALVVFGGKRSRAVRRSDLVRWIESRQAKPVQGVDDSDIERRMKRLERGPA